MKKETKDFFKNAGWGALLPCGAFIGVQNSAAIGLGLMAASFGRGLYVAVKNGVDNNPTKLHGWACGTLFVTFGSIVIVDGINYSTKAAVAAGLGVAVAVPAYKKVKEWIIANKISRSNGE